LIVVSDTSPILNLARIGRLDRLPSLYRQVLIPSAVYEWLIAATANHQKRVQEIREYLDPGEAEAIVLAIELRADLLLVDERRGRRVASAAGLAITACPVS
jgi:predicted nucleic acid-binding protein